MIYDISLTIRYDYASPAHSGRQTLHLLPRSIPHMQRVHSRFLSLAPPAEELTEIRDFFGNLQCDVVFQHPHTSLSYKLQAKVERFEQAASLDLSVPLTRIADDIMTCRSLDADQPHHFVSASPRVPVHPTFTDYARDQIDTGMTAQEAVIAIGKAIHRDMTFEPEATDVYTPVLEAFEKRHGVCQDFSHMMIGCLRGIGIPAAYVSGFLRTLPPENGKRLEGADAMHAWVKAWCGQEAGWLEYDPTNAIVIDQDHIVIAYGRDYSDVAPVKGVLRSSGGHTTSHAVDVVPL